MKNKKLKNGGPLVTPSMASESLTVKSAIIKSTPNLKLNADTMMNNFLIDNPTIFDKNGMDAIIGAKSQNYGVKSSPSKTRTGIIREKALGGLTTNENKLVESLQAFLKGGTNDVFQKKFSLGGQVLSTAAGMIPGIGGILSPVVSLIDQQITKDNKVVPEKPMNLNTNVYGNQMASGGFTTPNGVTTNMTTNNTVKNNNRNYNGKTAGIIAGSLGVLGMAAITALNSRAGKPNMSNLVQNNNTGMMPTSEMGTPPISEAFDKVGTPVFNDMAMYGKRLTNGGTVTKNFKQYNTGSHESGNDLNINAGGTGSNSNVTASVQNQENAYTNKQGSTYVHSDVLVNPESGNTFNIDAAKLNKKFSKADKSIEDQNALDFTMNRLSILNDKVRSIQESVQMALGGRLDNGGPTKKYSTVDDIPNNEYIDAELSIPPSDNAMFDANLDSLYEQPDLNMSKIIYDTSNLKPRIPERQLPNLDGLLSNKPLTTRDMTSTAGKDFNYNIPAMVLKGIGLAKSGVDALTPAEVEQPILTDYTKSDQQMYATNIDYTQAKQDAMAATNLAGNVNRSASGSFEQFQGRQANNYANLADSLGRVSMKEALDRNQQYVQRAGYEQGKAVDKSNRLTQTRINNQMNAANADLADQKFFSELTDIGSEFNQYQVYKDMVTNKKEIANATINEGLALIGSKYSNFGFTDDFMERIKSGTASIDEMVKFISTTEKVKASTKTTQ